MGGAERGGEKIIQGTASSWPREVRRSLEFFAASSSFGEIKKIYLSGGCPESGCCVPDRRADRDSVEFFNPFTKIEYSLDDFSPEYIKEVGPLAAVAVAWPCGGRIEMIRSTPAGTREEEEGEHPQDASILILSLGWWPCDRLFSSFLSSQITRCQSQITATTRNPQAEDRHQRCG